MVSKKWLVLVILVAVGKLASAQCILRLKGTVQDADTREKLSAATVTLLELKKTVETDEQGNFLLEGLCPGNYNLVVSHIGCDPVSLHIHLNDDLTKNIVLPHRHNELAEVTVTGAGKQKTTAQVGELKGAELEATRGLSLGEAVKRIAGVSTLQTGNNIYKPVIHGLHSNRVLVLNNGIRIEGQQWGSEHAPEVDPYLANRISVVKGAGSMRYGSDGLGGVILVEPRLLPNVPGVSGELNLAAFSNNRQGVVSGILEGNSARFRPFSWRLQGTIKRGGDAKTPNYWLTNSGNKEVNFSATAGWNTPTKGAELFYSQFNNTIGIFSGAHMGNLTDLENAIERGEPTEFYQQKDFSYTIDRPRQEIQHRLLKAKSFLQTGEIGRLNLTLSGQYNHRDEYDPARSSNSVRPLMRLDLYTLGSELVWDHYHLLGLRGTMGVTANYQYNSYEQRFFIPNYEALNLGAFWIERWDKNKWLLEGGVRADHRKLYNISNNDNSVVFDEKNYTSVSGNFGATYRLSPEAQFTLGASSAWRPPAINELYSDGLHHGVLRLEKGDASLTPERANTIQGNFNFNKGHWLLDWTIYHKNIDGFIYLRPGFPYQLTVRGAFPVFEYAQTDARLTGTDVSITYAYNKHLSVLGKASMLRAKDKLASDWLIQMPADRFEGEVTYTFSDGKFWKESYVKLLAQQVLRQSRTPGTGNIEVKQPDGSTTMASDFAPPPSGYFLAGAEAATTIRWGKQPIQLILGVQNAFNTRYRDYLNAFRYFTDERGRDVSLRVKIPFHKK